MYFWLLGTVRRWGRINDARRKQWVFPAQPEMRLFSISFPSLKKHVLVPKFAGTRAQPFLGVP